MRTTRHRSIRQGAEDSYLPRAPMQEMQPPTQQDITAPRPHYSGFPSNNQWENRVGRVRSFLAVLGTRPLRRFCCLAAEALEGADGQPVPL